jgi:hypothetical protein
MSKKQNKKNTPASNATSSQEAARLLPEEAGQVREQIAGRHSKAALQMAKDLHKRYGSAESEALLVEAYQARIDDLLKLGMNVEAKALMEIVKERFPAAAKRLADQQRAISGHEGKLDEVVAPLGDPILPSDDRERIENFIRQRIYDLPALAAVSSLPPEHSLRSAATALAAAFLAVTTGPVEDAVLALPEVSRRSPLASWKALVRAIASYHRREDEECRKWLQTIDDDSLPARLGPVLLAMRRGKPNASGSSSKLTPAAERLIAIAGDHGAALRPALAAMEKAFETKKQGTILAAARNVAAASDRCDPKLRERLRQHILARGEMRWGITSSLETALGGRIPRDATWFRLLARAFEEDHTAESDAEAALVWEDFRAAAIKENWFAAGGLEDGVLALHVARKVEKLPEDVVEEMHDREVNYRRVSKGAKTEALPSPGTLYERACKADPHPEALQMWLNWARKQKQTQDADHVAESWRRQRPADVQPLLYLMESAEKRNAFKKSLGYLEEAEKLDRLNPEVRRAKMRLLLSTVIRHLSQRKARLALGEIEQIEALPEVRPGEIATLAAALRWYVAGIDGDKAEVSKREAELNGLLGQAATSLLLLALMTEAKMKVPKPPQLMKFTRAEALEALAGAVKACVLGEGVGLRIQLPLGWNKTLMAALHLPNCPVDAAQLLTLGEAALMSLQPELAFTVSSVGLAGGRANARFLFLRARSLPWFAQSRRSGCFTAALELARQERNTELAGKILDALNSAPANRNQRIAFGIFNDREIASRAVSPELLSRVLEEEKELEQFPIHAGYREPKYADELAPNLCDCPKCKAKRGEPVGGMDFIDDDEDDDDFDDDEDFDENRDDFDGPPPSFKQAAKNLLEGLLRNLPPDIAQKVKEAIAAGEDPFPAIQRILKSESANKDFSAPPKIEKKAKTAKLPPPDQGSLF